LQALPNGSVFAESYRTTTILDRYRGWSCNGLPAKGTIENMEHSVSSNCIIYPGNLPPFYTEAVRRARRIWRQQDDELL